VLDHITLNILTLVTLNMVIITGGNCTPMGGGYVFIELQH